MKNLNHGCTYSDLWVHPKNWQSTTSKAALKKIWFVQCYFFDPIFKDKYPNGFPFRRKLNKGKTLEERKTLAKLLLEAIPKLFEEEGYNPITKKYNKIIEIARPNTFHKGLLIIDAFRLAMSNLKGSEKHLNEIRIAINRFEKAVKHLKIDDITINDFKRSELKLAFDYMNLTDNYYNKFRAYFSSLFVELIEYECCEINLTWDLKKRKISKNIRETLDKNQISQIANYLQDNQYNFYRYLKIFYFSGARSTELFSVQKKHVNIQKQEYKILLKKGKHYIEETKIIIPEAVSYWQDIILESNSPDDFLFSNKLKPGQVKISSRQITRRWKDHVKTKLAFKKNKLVEKKNLEDNDIYYDEITADFYSLKHLFLDELDKFMNHNSNDLNLSTAIASHRGTEITDNVYLVSKKKRKNELLKNIQITM